MKSNEYIAACTWFIVDECRTDCLCWLLGLPLRPEWREGVVKDHLLPAAATAGRAESLRPLLNCIAPPPTGANGSPGIAGLGIFRESIARAFVDDNAECVVMLLRRCDANGWHYILFWAIDDQKIKTFDAIMALCHAYTWASGENFWCSEYRRIVAVEAVHHALRKENTHYLEVLLPLVSPTMLCRIKDHAKRRGGRHLDLYRNAQDAAQAATRAAARIARHKKRPRPPPHPPVTSPAAASSGGAPDSDPTAMPFPDPTTPDAAAAAAGSGPDSTTRDAAAAAAGSGPDSGVATLPFPDATATDVAALPFSEAIVVAAAAESDSSASIAHE
jgi:hypothetical protein